MTALLAMVAGVWAALLANYVWLRADRKRRWKQRLGTPNHPEDNEPQVGIMERLCVALGRAVRRVVPISWISFIRRRLQAAGLRTTVEEFMGRWALIISIWYLLVSATAAAIPMPPWLSTPALAAALFFPFWHLANQEAERIRRIRKMFPFMIDFITMTVEAGLSMESGLSRVSQKMRGPLGDEARRYVQNVNRGMSRRDALLAFGEGVGVPEVNDFVHVLIQSSTFGIPLAPVLRAQSQQLREYRRLHAEEAAQKIPVKLLIPLVAFIFPTIMLLIIGPAAIWLLENL